MLIHWKPTTKQEEALVRAEFEIFFGGARGGGKTDAGMAFLLYDKDHPRYRALVIRKNSNDLNDWISRAKIMYRPTGAEFVKSEIRFPNGGAIVLGHLKDDNAYEKYQGHEYHKMLIEELPQIPSEESYLKLISSCRSTIPELRPQVFTTGNPGGRGHKWVKLRFGLTGDTRNAIRTIDPKTGRPRIFIPARVDDNPHIMENDPDYIKFLDGLPDGLREQWRYGVWDDVDIKGAYYGLMIKQAKAEGRITSVHYDPALPVYTVWDLGVSDTMSVGFWQRTSEKMRLIDYYENNNLGLAHYIKVVKEKPYIYGKHFAPHDIEQRELTTGITRKETAKKLGIDFEVVPNISIADGIDAARIMFSRVWIDEKNCEPFTDAIKQYRKEWDEKNLIFNDNPVHDWTSHPADMYRYSAVVEKQMTESNNFKSIMAQNEAEYISNPLK
jgi:hypothetical protein